MKLNPLVLFGLAGALGLVAFLATQQHLSAKTEEQKVPVLVARTEIRVGDPVTPENSAFKEIVVSALPARPITQPEQWEGQFAGSRFLPGEVIVQDKVAKKFGSDSRKIPPGMLVQTINVDRAKSHAGLLTPGDRVDVFGSFDVSETDKRTNRLKKYQMIKRILGDLEVWSVGSTVVGTEQGGDREDQKNTANRSTSTVGLLTTPEQYARLAGSEAAGKLFLGLRHPDDESDAGDISFITKDLYGDNPTQVAREQNAERAEPEPAPARPAAGAGAGPGDLGSFLDAEIAGAAAPAPLRAVDVPTSTVTLHVGDDTQTTEVVDVLAARAAGYSAAQIADKRRFLANPGSAVAASNPFEARFAARPAAPPKPPAATAAAADAPADGTADAEAPAPAPAADGGLSAGSPFEDDVQADGMYPAPE